jgi:hypothetical protein
VKTRLQSLQLLKMAHHFDLRTVLEGKRTPLKKSRPAVTAQQGRILYWKKINVGLTVLLFMTLLPQALFALVGCHFMAFALFTTWHSALLYLV